MEKPQKPTQSHEQERPKTLEDYAVKTFPADLDVTIRPLTVIRSGKDGGGIRDDEGWTPGDMLCVCKEGAGSIELFVKVHKLIKVYGEHVYEECVPITKIVSLKKLQSREANKGFNESYIQELYGKSTEEMLKEGAEAAERIWQQKYPNSDWNELLDVEAPSETPSDDLDTEGNSEKSLKDEVSPAMGNLAVKTVEVSSVKTNEAGVNSPALVMTKKVMKSIGAIKVNDSVGSPAVESAKKPAEIDKVGINPADLVATEPVKKPVETDKASAAPADLPAAKSVENPVVEKSMETNEANADMLLEDFKSVMNDFEKDTEENNGKFFAKVQYITGELNRFRGLIKYNPTAAMNDPVISEMITSEPDRIRNLEDSRAEDANEFKNNIKSLLESLKSKIENDDERRRLVKITEYVGQMGKDNVVLGDTTNNLLDKLIRIRRYIEGWQNDRWGADGYKSNISQVIGEIISDLSTASGHRQNIVDGIKRIKSEGYYQER